MKLTKNWNLKLWFWIAFSSFFLGASLVISSEVREAASGQFELLSILDQKATLFLGSMRSPPLNAVAIDITALGSLTIVASFIFLVAMSLALKRRYFQIVHLLVAGVGSVFLTLLMKSYFERPRPKILTHLVEVQGYSYPSGHSLSSAAVYFTFAILLCAFFQRPFERALIIGSSLFFILLIALSRVYLGVHYMSDVIAGVFVGISWASTLGAINAFFETTRTSNAI